MTRVTDDASGELPVIRVSPGTSPITPEMVRRALEEDDDVELGGALRRLAVYGTLAPGRSNHDQLSALPGRWLDGHVLGALYEDGWGAALGYPGLTLDPAG